MAINKDNLKSDLLSAVSLHNGGNELAESISDVIDTHITPPVVDIAMRNIHAEIEYLKEDGSKVHSDICPKLCSSEGLSDNEYREFLHGCLDEWLNNSRGTCGFYIKDAAYTFDA